MNDKFSFSEMENQTVKNHSIQVYGHRYNIVLCTTFVNTAKECLTLKILCELVRNDHFSLRDNEHHHELA